MSPHRIRKGFLYRLGHGLLLAAKVIGLAIEFDLPMTVVVENEIAKMGHWRFNARKGVSVSGSWTARHIGAVARESPAAKFPVALAAQRVKC